MRQRSYFWDNYKGIFIFLVVLGHYLYAYATELNGSLADQIFTFIYVFHMPAFIFCSGYLSKSERSAGKEALTKLLVYYLVFNTAMLVFDWLLQDSAIQFLSPYYSFWYILSLIFWRLITDKLANIKLIFPISLAVCLLLGFWGEFTNVLSIYRTIAFYPFFLMGYLYDREKFEHFLAKRSGKSFLFGIALTAAVGCVSFYVVSKYDITLNMLLFGAYSDPADALVRVFILAVSACVILAMVLLVPNKKLPFLTTLGKNSLLVYLAHRFFTLIYVRFVPVSSYTSVHLLYIFAASLLTCFLFANETLNRRSSLCFDGLTKAVLTPQSKCGKSVITVALLLLVLLLCIEPMSSLLRFMLK